MQSSKGFLLHSAKKRLQEGLKYSLNPHSCSSGVKLLHRSVEVCNVDTAESSWSGATPLASQGPYFSRLKNRGVIRFDGEDTFRFLQGLLTNDVSRFEKKSAPGKSPQPTLNQAAAYYPPAYTALLSPQGRFLYDLFLYRPIRPDERLDRTGSGPGETDPDVPVLLADVDSETVVELISLIKRHRLRAKVDIQDVSEDFAVWQRYGDMQQKGRAGGELSESGAVGWGGGLDTAAQLAAESGSKSWRWWTDPRLDALGRRGVFPSDSFPPLVEANEEVDAQYYQLWRLEQGVPEGPKEIRKGEAIPLEYNLDGLNAISFDKGCYVGQELIARTHHRGVIRKRIMPIHFIQQDGSEAQQAVGEGADIVDVSSQKKVGKVTTVLGPRGLGLVRLEALQKGAELGIENCDVHVNVVRPKWWPEGWGREEYPQAASERVKEGKRNSSRDSAQVGIFSSGS